MAEIEIRENGTLREKFSSDVDPRDADECVALLRRRAKDLRRPIDRLLLRAREPRKFWSEYRA